MFEIAELYNFMPEKIYDYENMTDIANKQGEGGEEERAEVCLYKI